MGASTTAIRLLRRTLTTRIASVAVGMTVAVWWGVRGMRWVTVAVTVILLGWTRMRVVMGVHLGLLVVVVTLVWVWGMGMGVISVTVALSVTIVVAVVVMMMRFAIVINTSSARITCLYIAGFSILRIAVAVCFR